MYRYGQIKGLTVVTMAEGKKVGRVDDLLVDPETKRVSWIRLGSGGVFGQQKWVPVEALHGVGNDAVTIRGEADILDSQNAPQAGSLVEARRPIIGNKAVTQDGQLLGTVQDYEFDVDSFDLANLLLTMRGTEPAQVIPANQVLTVGQDVIIVGGDAATGSAVIFESGTPIDPTGQ